MALCSRCKSIDFEDDHLYTHIDFCAIQSTKAGCRGCQFLFDTACQPDLRFDEEVEEGLPSDGTLQTDPESDREAFQVSVERRQSSNNGVTVSLIKIQDGYSETIRQSALKLCYTRGSHKFYYCASSLELSDAETHRDGANLPYERGTA